MSTGPTWYAIGDAAAVATPAVLVYPERIEANVRAMVARVGGPERLWPHVKTHKTPEIVALQQRLGIEQFKCATIAEAEMVAGCGAQRVLLALQPVGPNVVRWLELAARYPQTRFVAIVDCAEAAQALARAAQFRWSSLDLLLDINCGMGRTGIAPDESAVQLYRYIETLAGARAMGLHAYDGHIHDRDLDARVAAARAAMGPVRRLRETLQQQGCRVPWLIAGGTPTFPIHAADPEVQCSPGTCVLWDGGSAAGLPDLDFQLAAVVLARVVSKPAPQRLCLDLGHKAIASEMPPPRVSFLGLPDAVAIMHHEEHLVLESAHAPEFRVGDVLYGVPWHICPTMALHDRVAAVRGGRVVEYWRVRARDRRLTL